MGQAIFLCVNVGPDNCWWCDDPLTAIRRALGEPIQNEFGGRYCSQTCADRAAEDRVRHQSRCTVCGKHAGACTTDHPEDPHAYESMGVTR